ncbi:hypothetical protein RUM43_010917 [Polyplax serrata]|uniref:Uncharacterized protein n=1 Tax=Polyplax serrata TaxID=468196 RepID=A0AAN8RZK3_POLSC
MENFARHVLQAGAISRVSSRDLGDLVHNPTNTSQVVKSLVSRKADQFHCICANCGDFERRKFYSFFEGSTEPRYDSSKQAIAKGIDSLDSLISNIRLYKDLSIVSDLVRLRTDLYPAGYYFLVKAMKIYIQAK